MNSESEKHTTSLPVRICVALLTGVLSGVAVLAVFGFLARSDRHVVGPLAVTELALLVAVFFGSAVAIRLLRPGRKEPMMY